MSRKVSSSSFALVSLHGNVLILAGLILLFSVSINVTQAEVPPITPSGLNTQVNLSATPLAGHVQYDITGGTRPGGGVNLFHSFGDFNVPTNNIANFLNDSGLPTSNILGRVTGGNISNIFGTIQTTGFGNANLFLMNPTGFLFGPNATVHVGGMVTFASADYLRLTDGARFNAVPNAAADALLTALPVASFGFLGSNPGAITVQGSQFSVTDGQSISLVGGNISIESGTPEAGTAQPARLSAANGKILLASAASPGEFDAATLQALPNVDGASFTSFGSVALAPSSHINISGANTVSIRGGQFVLSVNDAVLTTAKSAGQAETISFSPNSSIISSNAGVDPGADVQVIAGNLQMDGASIQTLTTGDGPGGNISIGGQIVSLTNGAQIVSATQGLGQGGTVSVTADSITIAGFDSEGTLPGVLTDGVVRSGIFSTSSSPGTGGDITINAPTIVLDQLGTISTTTISDAQGGNITVEGTTLSMTGGGEIRSETGMIDPDSGELVGGTGQGGNISVTTGESVLVSGLFGFSRSGITSGTFAGGTGGEIILSSPHVLIDNGGSLRSFSAVDGAGGNISITALESLIVRGFQDISILGLPDFRIVSRISNEAAASGFGTGNSGSVNISAGTMAVENQGYIQTITFGQGNAGNLTVNSGALNISGGGFIDSTGAGEGATGRVSVTATGTLSIQGSPGFDDLDQSRISNTQDGEAANGGISVHAKDIVMTEGGRIRNDSLNQSSSTTLIGDNSITIASGSKIASRDKAEVVGPIELSAPSITLDQGSITTRTATTATGGAITLSGQNITLTNGSELASATEQSSGQGGPITVTASDSITVSGGSTIQSISIASGPAGSVNLTATNSIALTGLGTIVSTEASGSGSGGLITIQSNQIQITDGAGVSAKSAGSGAAGSVVIEGPQSPAQSVLIDGFGSGIFTNTEGAGAGGNIFVNANSVTLQNGGTLSAATSGTAPTATGGTITIAATDVQLSNGASINAQTTGAGNAGNILVKADSVSITDGAQLTSSSVIGDSGEIPTGNAGNITIQGLAGPAQSVLITGIFDENFNLIGGISTETQGTGAGGTINISAHEVQLTDGATLSAQTSGSGNAGNILLQTTGNLSVSDSYITSEANPNLTRGVTGGRAGTIQLLAGQDISLTNSQISTLTGGNKGGGEIVLNGNNLLVEGTFLLSSSLPAAKGLTGGDAGDIRIEVNGTTRFVGSEIKTSTGGNGSAGNIFLTTSMLSLEDSNFESTTQLPVGRDVIHGSGGNILLKVDQMTVTGNSLVSSESNNSVGQAGNITVIAKSVELFGSGTQPNTITTNSYGAAPSCPGKCGDAGTISITAQTLTLDRAGIASATFGDGNAGSLDLAIGTLTVLNGSQLSAGANGPLSTGAGGSISINATGSVDISNPGQIGGHSRPSGVLTNTGGSGPGGNILVNANTVTLQNGGTLSATTLGTAPTATGGTVTVNATNTVTMNSASITASSTGPGNTGNIQINAGNLFSMTNSSVTTEANQASGGAIKITTTPSGTVELNNSTISASVLDGAGGGGSVNIDPQYVLLQNSQILAQAVQGPGGNITINITNGGLFLPDANSTVSASSQFGVNGTVTIQSPNAPASGQIQPLGKSPLIATSLLNQRCASLAGGEFSSFTVAGRDSLPTEPGGWLASPLALSTLGGGTGLAAKDEGERLVTRGEGLEGMTLGASPAGETALLALRQIAPAGFLTQTFAENWSAGCKS